MGGGTRGVTPAMCECCQFTGHSNHDTIATDIVGVQRAPHAIIFNSSKRVTSESNQNTRTIEGEFAPGAQPSRVDQVPQTVTRGRIQLPNGLRFHLGASPNLLLLLLFVITTIIITNIRPVSRRHAYQPPPQENRDCRSMYQACGARIEI